MEIKQEYSLLNDKEDARLNFNDITEDILSLNQVDGSIMESINENSLEQLVNGNNNKLTTIQKSRNHNKTLQKRPRILSSERNTNKSSTTVEPIEIKGKENDMNYNNNYIVKYNEIGVLVIHDHENDLKRTVLDLFKEQHDIVFQNEAQVYLEALHPKFETFYTVTPATLPAEGVIYLKHRASQP